MHKEGSEDKLALPQLLVLEAFEALLVHFWLLPVTWVQALGLLGDSRAEAAHLSPSVHHRPNCNQASGVWEIR